MPSATVTVRYFMFFILHEMFTFLESAVNQVTNTDVRNYYHVCNNVNEIVQAMIRGYISNLDAIKYSVHPFKILHDAIYIKIKNYIYTYIVQY